ncbi:MAG: hypothetical protein AB1894_07375 [Chloroflexota bacterium]
MHALKDSGLVTKNDDGNWVLTIAGKAEVVSLQTKAALQAKETAIELANLSRVARLSFTPFEEIAQRAIEYQSALANTVTESMTSRYQAVLDEALASQKLYEIATQQSVFLAGLDVNRLVSASPLQEIAKGLAMPSLIEAAARMGEIDFPYSRLIQEAASFATLSQNLNTWALNISGLTPDIVRQLGQSGVSMSRMISAIAALKTSQPLDDIYRQLAPHVNEVTRTYLNYHSVAISRLESEKRLLETVTVPSYVTADYIDAVATVVVPATDVDEPKLFHSDVNDHLIPALENVGPQFSKMWIGAWEAANSDNPDRLRQAAHSGRELLMQILAYHAPDNVFTQEEIEKDGKGQITHRMRLEKILANNPSKSKWAGSVADAVIVSLNELQGISHYRSAEPPANQLFLIGMLITLGGLLIVCLQTSDTSNKQ